MTSAEKAARRRMAELFGEPDPYPEGAAPLANDLPDGGSAKAKAKLRDRSFDFTADGSRGGAGVEIKTITKATIRAEAIPTVRRVRAASAEPIAADPYAPPVGFTVLAYSGGPMPLDGWTYPVIVDLDGVGGVDKSRPIFFTHDPLTIVGHTTSINVGDDITAAGIVSAVSGAALEIVGAADNGFPWQASVGMTVLANQFIDAGKTVAVNGQTFKGPINVARQTKLKEISVVALGADDNTSFEFNS